MPNSSTSTGGPRRFSDRDSRWCRSIPKKKELVGQFRTGGREWHPQGQPEEVEVYDFAKKDLGKVIPYGVYDQTTNAGWVSVGIDHDTAEFAVETLRRWWRKMGSKVYPAPSGS